MQFTVVQCNIYRLHFQIWLYCRCFRGTKSFICKPLGILLLADMLRYKETGKPNLSDTSSRYREVEKLSLIGLEDPQNNRTGKVCTQHVLVWIQRNGFRAKHNLEATGYLWQILTLLYPI